jgi:hypothetical protein
MTMSPSRRQQLEMQFNQEFQQQDAHALMQSVQRISEMEALRRQNRNLQERSKSQARTIEDLKNSS